MSGMLKVGAYGRTSPQMIEGAANLGGMMKVSKQKNHLTPQDMLDLGLRAMPGTYNQNDWAPRPDGSQKGYGYLGLLTGRGPNKGNVLSEYSIGVQMDGKNTDIPTLVPTLTPQEVLQVINGQISEGIVRKAADHARERMAQGLSVFADPSFRPSVPHGGGR